MDVDADLTVATLFRLQHGGIRVPQWPQAMIKVGKNYEESCYPLPLYLQDLCLLVVINDLGSYPEELLASLPQWLRYRLLSSLPAMELSRLEYSPVAKGVDTEAIWKSRFKEMPADKNRKQGAFLSQPDKSDLGSSFQLNVCKIDHGHNDTTIRKSVEDITKLPPGHEYLLEIASKLLCESYGKSVENSIQQLISIPGGLLLSALVTDSTHQSCQRPFCKVDVWKRQGTPLVQRNADAFHRSYSSYSQHVQLTPRYLMPVYQNADSVTMLSSLVKGCRLHPSSANVHINAISESVLSGLVTERFVLDSGSSHPTKDLRCTPTFQHLLRKVVYLTLKCEKYGHIGVMIGMIESAIADGQDSKLKHLRCVMPNMYMDIVEPLSSLFSLQNFRKLTMDLEELYPLMLTKLLKAFFNVPCQHTQKLHLNLSQGVQLPRWITKSELASIDVGGTNIQSCGYKILKFASATSFTNPLKLLLQYSTLRLEEITFENGVHNHDSHNYFHLCALHPDLQATKIVIDVDNINSTSHLPTVQEDFISLFKMQSLQKISVRGWWGHMTEIKLGLALGLQGRSHLPPLEELSLDLYSADSYKIRDFQMLCDSIFSLPQLENLKLVLGKGFVNMIKQKHFEEVIYKSWHLKGSRIKLKLILLLTREIKLAQFPFIAQNVSFSHVYRPKLFDYIDYDDIDSDSCSDLYDYPDAVYYDSDDHMSQEFDY